VKPHGVAAIFLEPPVPFFSMARHPLFGHVSDKINRTFGRVLLDELGLIRLIHGEGGSEPIPRLSGDRRYNPDQQFLERLAEILLRWAHGGQPSAQARMVAGGVASGMTATRRRLVQRVDNLDFDHR
jgi:hypothetical protein